MQFLCAFTLSSPFAPLLSSCSRRSCLGPPVAPLPQHSSPGPFPRLFHSFSPRAPHPASAFTPLLFSPRISLFPSLLFKGVRALRTLARPRLFSRTSCVLLPPCRLAALSFLSMSRHPAVRSACGTSPPLSSSRYRVRSALARRFSEPVPRLGARFAPAIFFYLLPSFKLAPKRRGFPCLARRHRPWFFVCSCCFCFFGTSAFRPCASRLPEFPTFRQAGIPIRSLLPPSRTCWANAA